MGAWVHLLVARTERAGAAPSLVFPELRRSRTVAVRLPSFLTCQPDGEFGTNHLTGMNPTLQHVILTIAPLLPSTLQCDSFLAVLFLIEPVGLLVYHAHLWH